MTCLCIVLVAIVGFFFQAEDGIRDLVRSRGLGDVYKRQHLRMRTPRANNYQLTTPLLKRRIERRRRRVSIRRGGGGVFLPIVARGRRSRGGLGGCRLN